MKKIFLLTLLPLIFQGHQANLPHPKPESSPEFEKEEPAEKLYVAPSQLAFTNREIFAYLGGQWIPVEGVCKDAKGVYVKNPYHHRWLCPDCHYNNNGWDKTCQREYLNGRKCGASRPW